MAKFGHDKIALALACASILGGKASAINNFNGVKNSQASGAARVGINASGSKNNLTQYISYAGAGLGGTALGTALGWLLFHNKKESDKKEVDTLRQDYEAGKKIYIDFRKKNCASNGVKGLYFSNVGLVWYNNAPPLFDDVVTTQCPALKDKKDVNFQQKRAEIRKAYYTFSNAYNEIKLKELWEIANKHKISFNNSGAVPDGYFDARLYFIHVEKAKDKNGKLSVRILAWNNNNHTTDATEGFNIAEPSNDEQQNKKKFYDAVVDLANQDEVMKAVLLGDEKKDEKKDEKEKKETTPKIITKSDAK